MTEEERSFLTAKLKALQINQRTHYAASERYQRLNWLIGSMVVIISTAVGSFAFTDFASFPSYLYLAISLGSLISAVLASILTFSGFNELAGRHKYAGTHYGRLARTIEGWLAGNSQDQGWQKRFEELNDTWCEISDAAPITYFHARKKLGDRSHG